MDGLFSKLLPLLFLLSWSSSIAQQKFNAYDFCHKTNSVVSFIEKPEVLKQHATEFIGAVKKTSLFKSLISSNKQSKCFVSNLKLPYEVDGEYIQNNQGWNFICSLGSVNSKQQKNLMIKGESVKAVLLQCLSKFGWTITTKENSDIHGLFYASNKQNNITINLMIITSNNVSKLMYIISK